MPVSRKVQVAKWSKDERSSVPDEVAVEVPVALSYNRLSHVVMMATPNALEDFATGFSLTEGILEQLSELHDIRVVERGDGIEIAMTVAVATMQRLQKQRRNLVGRTGCGLCGAESLQQANRAPSPVPDRVVVKPHAIQAAVKDLDAHQALQQNTGAVHGAAWCDLNGGILHLREDVGRHNALDKLIGHLARSAVDCSTGFAVISSRASYEMVYKAAAADIEVLVAVSAPTTLAIEFANRCGLTLVGFARPGRHNVYTLEGRVENV
jgi:FdhD protein